MPIEIRELHIRVSVSPAVDVGPAGAPGTAPGGRGDAREAREALVADCVERVLEILRDSRER